MTTLQKQKPGDDIALLHEHLRKGYIYFKAACKYAIGRYLSNFADSSLVFRGEHFRSVENAFQAAKFLYSDRPELFSEKAFTLKRTRKNPETKQEETYITKVKIGDLPPPLAKSAGSKGGMKKVRATLDIQKWNQVHVDIMRELIGIRVRSDRLFRKILKKARDTGTKLLHFESANGKKGAPPFWGGYFKGNSRQELGDFFGHNTLGEIMMTVPL